MASRPAASPPTRFLWQGVLILLPLLFLSGAAVWTLQRQRVIFDEEERRRAEETANLYLPMARNLVVADLVDAHPPLPSQLGVGPDWDRFLSSLEARPPQEQAVVELANRIDAVLDRAAREKDLTALEKADALITAHPELRTPAGLPASPLVIYQRLRLDEPATLQNTEQLATWLISHWPCPISRRLFAETIEIVASRGGGSTPILESVYDRLAENEARIELLKTYGSDIPPFNQFLLTDDSGASWLLVRNVDSSESSWLQSFKNLEPSLTTLTNSSRSSLPAGAGLEFRVVGQPVIPASPEGDPRNVLATASDDLIEVRLVIADSALFYQRLDQRTRLFGGLVATAVAVGLAGFFVSRHAFNKQQRLNTMKSNFVSSVSHELRAPIASVRLLAERLDDGQVEDQAKQREYFGFIVQECRRLGSLIENVLDFSRIEQQQKRYTLAETDIEALIRETVSLMEPAAGEKEMRLEVVIDPPDDPFPRIDGLAIQQALVNLIDNAIKYAPAGTVIRVELAPGEGSEAADFFRLSVADGGPGVPDEERDRIFDRFYRSGSELRRSTQGVGIGLSIVKHIVEGHGGRVELSGDGKGAVFTLVLPVGG